MKKMLGAWMMFAQALGPIMYINNPPVGPMPFINYARGNSKPSKHGTNRKAIAKRRKANKVARKQRRINRKKNK